MVASSIFIDLYYGPMHTLVLMIILFLCNNSSNVFILFSFDQWALRHFYRSFTFSQRQIFWTSIVDQTCLCVTIDTFKFGQSPSDQAFFFFFEQQKGEHGEYWYDCGSESTMQTLCGQIWEIERSIGELWKISDSNLRGKEGTSLGLQWII